MYGVVELNSSPNSTPPQAAKPAVLERSRVDPTSAIVDQPRSPRIVEAIRQTIERKTWKQRDSLGSRSEAPFEYLLMAHNQLLHAAGHILDGHSKCSNQDQSNPCDTGGPDEERSSAKIINNDRPDERDADRYNGEK
jgi:hypothetical protein